MRVLHLMIYDGPGGYSRVIYDLCRAAPAGTAAVATMHEGTWTTRLRAIGIPVASLRPVLEAEELHESLDKLTQLLDGIDLVNVHVGPVYQPILVAIVSLLRSELPVVFTMHWALRLPVTRSDIICTSRAAADVQRASNRCHVIENGVDRDEFHPPARRPEDTILIRVCRPERSAHYFWDSVTPVLRRHPDVRLWIVGEDGTSTEQIKYLGYRNDVAELLRSATIFTYAPRPDEGSADLAILEAMATGVVPVVPDVLTTRAVRNGRDGIVVPYGDVLALERALERAVANPARTRRMAVCARATAKGYDIRAVARRYTEIYAAVMTRSAGTGGARRPDRGPGRTARTARSTRRTDRRRARPGSPASRR